MCKDNTLLVGIETRVCIQVLDCVRFRYSGGNSNAATGKWLDKELDYEVDGGVRHSAGIGLNGEDALEQSFKMPYRTKIPVKTGQGV